LICCAILKVPKLVLEVGFMHPVSETIRSL